MKKIIISTICIISIIFSFLFSACSYAFYNLKKLNYIELQDVQNKILWRSVKSYNGGGYITIKDKKVDAEFSITLEGDVRITVKRSNIDSIDEGSQFFSGKYAVAFVEFYDLNKNKELISVRDDVTIFGEYYGKIVLKCRDADRSTFDASEYILGWQTQDDDLLSLSALDYPHLNKLLWFKIEIDGTENDYVFQWQAEKKFSIYKYKTNEDPIGEFLACGTYVNVENKATLTFVEDNLFNFKYPTIELVAEFYNEM